MDKQIILEYLADGSEICRACIDRAEKTGSAAAITSLLRLREIINQPINKAVEDGQAKCTCSPNGVQVKCDVHGFTGGFIAPPARHWL